MIGRGSLLESLRALAPTEFENAVYDLVSLAGLRNAVWRTPGADAGRDIEGEYPTIDFSGFHASVRWYVECKRYEKSVDWPTVWEKIAYAENHGADCLLVVTTAPLSPQCKTEISRRNADNRRPKVRFWDATNLEQVLGRYPAVIVKHGLSKEPHLAPESLLSLAQQSSKVIQAAYGIAELAGNDNPALEAASAVSELLTVRLRDAEMGGQLSGTEFILAHDGYPWLKPANAPTLLSRFDRYGLRAVLAVIRHISAAKELMAATDDNMVTLTLPTHRLSSGSAHGFLIEVSTWANIEIRITGKDTIVMTPRTSND